MQSPHLLLLSTTAESTLWHPRQKKDLKRCATSYPLEKAGSPERMGAPSITVLHGAPAALWEALDCEQCSAGHWAAKSTPTLSAHTTWNHYQDLCHLARTCVCVSNRSRSPAKMWILPLLDTFIQSNDCLKSMLRVKTNSLYVV